VDPSTSDHCLTNPASGKMPANGHYCFLMVFASESSDADEEACAITHPSPLQNNRVFRFHEGPFSAYDLTLGSYTASQRSREFTACAWLSEPSAPRSHRPQASLLTVAIWSNHRHCPEASLSANSSPSSSPPPSATPSCSAGVSGLAAHRHCCSPPPPRLASSIPWTPCNPYDSSNPSDP